METSAASPKAVKRLALRQRRRTLSPAAQAQAGRCLSGIARENMGIREFRTIAGYIAQDGEIDPAMLLEVFREAGAKILLPRTGPHHSLVFAPEGTLAMTGPAGIPDPTQPEVELEAAPRPGLLLVPSVALSPSGGRLGRGGGFYDRILARARNSGWQIVGVCHDDAVCDELPLEHHDEPVDWVLTEKRLSRAGANE